MRIQFTLAVCVVFGTALPACGQRLLLQSPVFARFAVNTTVSVPDRGSALSGSVSRAADGTKSFGPIPNGSSRGRSLSHRSVRSSVYIHDFAAMDPFLRDRYRTAPPPDPVQEKREREARAAVAYRKLADKAERNGKLKLARRYQQLARDYEMKTRVAGRPGKR